MDIEYETDPSPELPPVSIIIPAHNERKYIGKCLESLSELDYPCFETIVVDDGSIDGTYVIVNDFRGKLSNLFLIRFEKNHGRGYARNQGVKRARFEILVFLDADCLADNNWLKLLVSKMMETRTCAAGRILTANSGISRWADEEGKRIGLYWMKECPRAVTRGFKTNLSGIFGIQRTLFDEIGEFDETLPYREDGDYFKRLTVRGKKVAFAPSAVVFHHHPTSLISYFRRGVAVAKATYLLNQKHGDPFRGTFRKRTHESLCLMVSVVLLIILTFAKYFALSLIKPVVVLLLLLFLFLSFRSDLPLALKVLFGKKSVSGAVLDFVQHQGERCGFLTSIVFRKKWENKNDGR